MDSDGDEDLARAIALSMQEAEGAKPKMKKPAVPEPEVLVISSDEEEDVVEMPARAKLSARNPAPGPSTSKLKPTTKREVPVAPPSAGAGPLSFLGDRAQMERERVARQKRLRGPSPPPVSSGEGEGEEYESDASESGSGSQGSARKRARLEGKMSGMPSARTFPDGAVLRVETQHATTPGTPGIRLSELLGPREALAFAVLSAYVVDPAWIYSFFDPATPVVLVTDPATCGADVDAEDPTLKNMFPNWVRVCPPLHAPPMRGCMHMKYMLLFAKSSTLRVVVSSANLVPHDWRDVENYVFVLDVPRAAPGESTARLRGTEKPGETFPAVLAGTLRATGVEEALAIMRRQGHSTLPLPTLLANTHKKKSALETGWDWRRVRAALVPSVPGRYEGWGAVCGTGQPRLMRAVQALGCSLEGGSSKGKGKGKAGECVLELDCLTSSIGTYTPPWLAIFRLCAGGRARALEAWLDRGRRKTPPAKGPIRVLFPTLAAVRGTTLGEKGAGTVFCRRGQWEKIRLLVADTDKGLEMRDARSRSGGVGMHTKMILGTLRAPETDPDATESDTESDSEVEVLEVKGKGKGNGAKDTGTEEKERPHAWLYVGSHNFTASAWGTLSGSGFNPVLNVTNYELGVVLRLETPAAADAAVAWARPAARYARGDVPWMQEESPFFR
ncbi:tyrosyl-DNA phosphodiesterase-domain-containing protein [Mycena vulgaris]|nr:tyrosyl-DNA phosphodiesterase-domain-containing protein [Mycena vulgaris]